MLLNFFAPSLNFQSTPSTDFFEMTNQQIIALLEIFAYFCFNKKTKYNLSNYDIIVKSPFHCIIAKNNEKLIIGFSRENAILGNSILASFRENLDIPFEDAKVAMVSSAKREIGISDFLFTSYNFKVVKESATILQNSYDELKIRNGRLFEHFNEEYVQKGDHNAENLVYSSLSAADELFINIERKNSIMHINPIFKAENLVIDPKMVFCALPFNESRLEIFTEIIRPHLESMELNAIKINDVKSITGNIMENIWTYINKSRCVIVDISDRNPNVFYELGICHTVGKDTIIICDEDSFKNDYNNQFPFDISGLNTIVYKNKGAGMERLKEELSLVIQAVLTGKDVIA